MLALAWIALYLFTGAHRISRIDERAVPFPFTDGWETSRAALERYSPRYILADKHKEQVSRHLIPMAARYPEVFRPIRDEADVRAYAVTLP